MSEYQHWLLKEEGLIATLSLNRPEEGNSLTVETFHELRDITNHLRNNQSIWVVIVEGIGRHFSTGVDVAVLNLMTDVSGSQFREALGDLQACLDSFEALEKPTIAKIHGFCLGGGIVLALCCDFRIASQRTIMGFPEVKRGIPVIMGTQRVTRIAGVALAKEWILLGEYIKGSDAEKHGLVHKVVPPEKLDQAAISFAKKFLKLPPRTVAGAKRIVDAGANLSLRASQDLEIEVQAGLLDSPDFKEALSSFIEGRPPSFVGE
jgi:enoyl-CoA hydratase/carnithine racemase